MLIAHTELHKIFFSCTYFMHGESVINRSSMDIPQYIHTALIHHHGESIFYCHHGGPLHYIE